MRLRRPLPGRWSVIQRQQGILLRAVMLPLRTFPEKKSRKQHGEGQTHEDGDSENFH
jgi:hypothetical protein